MPRVTLEIVLSLGHERLISEIKVKSQHCRPARTLGTGKDPGRELNNIFFFLKHSSSKAMTGRRWRCFRPPLGGTPVVTSAGASRHATRSQPRCVSSRNPSKWRATHELLHEPVRTCCSAVNRSVYVHLVFPVVHAVRHEPSHVCENTGEVNSGGNSGAHPRFCCCYCCVFLSTHRRPGVCRRSPQ